MVEYKIANEKGKSVDEDIKGNGIEREAWGAAAETRGERGPLVLALRPRRD